LSTIDLHSRKLPDTCRLKSPGQFSSVFKAANRKGGRFFTLFILRRDDDAVPRLGIAVAKRFFKRAHERNRFKRLVRENFRIHKETLVGLDVVIVMKKEASLRIFRLITACVEQIANCFKTFCLIVIRFYQRALSPFWGIHCRFEPSCSSYTYQAIQLHGVIRGVWLGGNRICRCHPWKEGGYDPVPKRKIE
jgi:uncharacterized protein